MRTKTTGNKLFIYFSPTQPTRESWLKNFRFWKKPYKRMTHKFYVHAGFLQRWKKHEEGLAGLIDEDIRAVRITGYSQGGAIAVLAHEWVWFHYPRLRDTLSTKTQGAPRCISIIRSRAIKERFEDVTRYEHRGDIVCRLPFAFMLYKHVGKRTRLGRWTPFFWKAHQQY